MKISFTDHANQKLAILGSHNVKVTKKLVEEILKDPKRVVSGLGGRQIAEGSLDENHILRVVFMREGERRLVVTMYPARRDRY